MKNRIILIPLSIVLGLLVALQGCNFSSSQSSDNRIATVEALETSVAATVTSAASQSAPNPQSPQLQATAPQSEQQQATVSQPAPVVQVTQPPVQVTSPPGDQNATQAALSPIQADLSIYGVDPNQGSVGWIQPPLHLEVNQYQGRKFDNKFPTVIAQDFVMSSDITWNTQYGGSGCGFVFRSNGNQQTPSQYMVVATRLAGGHIIFAVMAQGQMMIVKDFYPHVIDSRFNAENGATNRLAVIGQGSTFAIYTNGVKIGDADPNAPLPPLVLPSPPVKPINTKDQAAMAAYQQALAQYKQETSKLKDEYNQRVALWNKLDKNFPSGFTALGVVADSGQTTCDFNNAWLWLMGAPQGPAPMLTMPPGFSGTIPPEYQGTIAAATAMAQGTPPAPAPMQTMPPGFSGTIPPEYQATIAAATAMAQGTPAP
jgi:hypothetical protein